MGEQEEQAGCVINRTYVVLAADGVMGSTPWRLQKSPASARWLSIPRVNGHEAFTSISAIRVSACKGLARVA